MISIVICSRDKEALNKVSSNVDKTIGVIYEIIAIDNSQGKYGICEAYNIGASRSKYSLLCFMHEDLYFHTANWGGILLNIFLDETIGVLGVAGSLYQLNAPAPWWFMGADYTRMQVIHTIPNQLPSIDINNPHNVKGADVAVVDGLWFCSPKEVWEQYPFDQKNFPEFHFYDIDYCTSIFSNYRICVSFEISIEHFSKGSINASWLINAFNYQRKWMQKLPFGVVEVEQSKSEFFERFAVLDFLDRFSKSNFSFKVALRVFRQLYPLYPFKREMLGMFKRYLKQQFSSNISA